MPVDRWKICLILALLLFPAAGHAGDGKVIEVQVRKGDSLYNLCRQYLEEPNDWPKVARLNHLGNPHLIHPGQTIHMPVKLLRGVPVEGWITFVQGNVTLQEDAESSPLPVRLHQRISEESLLETGADGAVELTYEDGTSVLLRSRTTIWVTRARRKGDNHLMRQLYQGVGRTFSEIKKAAGREQGLEIETPSAVASSRGTGFRVTVDESRDTRCEVLHGRIGVTGAGRTVEVEQDRGTLVEKGRKPSRPSELLPPPELRDAREWYKSLPLGFRFSQVPDASLYRIMLSSDPDFKGLLREKLTAPGEATEFDRLEDGTYFLAALSIDAQGLEGRPSPAFTVRLRTRPEPPFIQNPVHGSEVRRKDKRVRFKWLKVPDAEMYHLQVAEDAEMARLIIDEAELRGSGSTHTLPEFQSCHYRIASIAGDGYQGPWSDVLHFDLVPPPPAPELEAPAVDEDAVTLRWRDQGPGFSYHIQVAGDEAFDEIIVDQNVQQPQASFEKPGWGDYFVRTSSIDPDGYEGEFSPPQTFEVGPGWLLGVPLGLETVVVLIGVLL